MKRLLVIGWACAAVALGARAAEEGFSQTVRAADFSAAGLEKLTPEELARLDTLVRDYKSGVLMAAQREAEATAQAKAVVDAQAVAAKAEARAAAAMRAATEAKAAAEAKVAKAEVETQVARAEASRAKESFMGGLLAKAKVVLTPGTEVEYTSIDTQLAVDFRGWSKGTVFILANGQHWQVTDSSTYATPPESGPHKVRIVPGALGSFFLEIEGVRQKPRVSFVGGGK
jgi:hypothetical protein